MNVGFNRTRPILKSDMSKVVPISLEKIYKFAGKEEMEISDRPIILGRYSPSQNRIVVSPYGPVLCLAGGQRSRYGQTEDTD